MTLDPRALVERPPHETTISWTDRDVLLYHLSLGAGVRAGEPELPFVYEPYLSVLPTFALVAGHGVSTGAPTPMPLELLDVDVDMRNLLHVGQELEVTAPLPVSGDARLTTSVGRVWDKGRAAVVEVVQQAHIDGGEPLWTSTMQMWIQGAGGFGGDSGPSSATPAPEGDPGLTTIRATRPDQALLYRLNGDLNPLHVDPVFAREAGLERPILHGLASFGILAKALVDELLSGDPSRLRRLACRFSGPVHAGETLRVAVWPGGSDLVFEVSCAERDAPVLSRGTASVVLS